MVTTGHATGLEKTLLEALPFLYGIQCQGELTLVSQVRGQRVALERC